MTSIDDVQPTVTAWTEGRIIEKDSPATGTTRLRMHVEDRIRHRPGQHYLIRLRAPDDYTAQRSYSVASDDDDPLVEFLVETLPDGEVSEFLADVAEVGDVLEMRGPIGRWFTWDTTTPALCLVGGTGVVPAVSMLRTARRLGRRDLLRRDLEEDDVVHDVGVAGQHLRAGEPRVLLEPRVEQEAAVVVGAGAVGGVRRVAAGHRDRRTRLSRTQRPGLGRLHAVAVVALGDGGMGIGRRVRGRVRRGAR